MFLHVNSDVRKECKFLVLLGLSFLPSQDDICFQSGKVIVIILSVSIPLLVTLLDQHAYIKYIIAGVGVLIAAVEGILSLYDFQNNWISYRQTLEALKREKFFFATKSSVYKADKSFQFFVERIETILTVENKNWSESTMVEVKVEKED